MTKYILTETLNPALDRIIFIALFFHIMLFFAPLTFADQSSYQIKEKESRVFQLKNIIEKTRQRIDELDEKLKEDLILKRNERRAEKFMAYYAAAKRLYEKGKYKEAKRLWQKLILITQHPQMRGYLKEAALKEKKLKLARWREEKQRLGNLSRGTTAQLQKVIKEQEALIEKRKQNESLALENKVQFQKLMRRQQEEAQEDEQKRDRTELIYQEALKLYQTKSWPRAKEKFHEAEKIIADYRSTRKFLAEIDKDIENAQRQSLELEQKALAEQRKQEQFVRLQEENESKRQQELEAKKSQEERKRQLEDIYQTAMTRFHQGDYTTALSNFMELERIFPDYKKTRQYLTKSDQALKIEKEHLYNQLQERLIIEKDAQRLQKETDEMNQELVLQQKYDDALKYYLSKGLLEAKKEVINIEKENKTMTESEELLISRRNKFREKKARQYYNEAEALYKKGQYHEAKTLWRKAVDLIDHLEMRRYSLEKDLKDKGLKEALSTSRGVDQVYQQALVFIKIKKFLKAEEKMDELERISPNDQKTRLYLRLILRELEKEDQRRGQKIRERIETSLNKQEIAAGQKLKNERLRKKEQERLAAHRIKELYIEAVRFYQQKHYILSLEIFKQIKEAYPRYRYTSDYIKRINRYTQKENQG